MDYASKTAQDTGIRSGGLGAAYQGPGTPQPRKQTTSDLMVNDMRELAMRSENISNRVGAILNRLGAPRPPSCGGKTSPADVGGLFENFKEQGSRIRDALSDAETNLNELEQHI